MKRKQFSWAIAFCFVISMVASSSGTISETGATSTGTTSTGTSVEHRRRLFDEHNGYGSRGYSAFLEPKYFWRGNAWLYPTYPVAPPQTHMHTNSPQPPPQIWCHRYQSEVRCWDWNCHWDYHYNKCREMTLMGETNENPTIMTVQIALRVFAFFVCIFVFIRLLATACAACFCSGWETPLKYEHDKDLLTSSDEEDSNYEYESEEDEDEH